ncbi:gas vesicle protein [Streptomyces sp. NPDC020800]|uniref:gas vesicle protein n=1 Tax=Streptomyces sp. NPDC020800 TaxID=3365092 RepID=UPI00379C2F3F
MAASETDGTGSGRRPSHGDDTARRSRSSRAARPARQHSAAWAMRRAAGQLEELLGRGPESVSAIKPTEEGWEADVEVLELERVPETTSVLGTYHVTLDEEGDLLAYERTRRYTRGQIDRRR